MRRNQQNSYVVLVLFAGTRGFGYAVMEGPSVLVDWGAKQVGGNKNLQCLKRITDLLALFRPHIVVVESVDGRYPRKSARIRKLLQKIKELLKKKGIKCISFTRAQIRAAFAKFGAFSKYEIAREIARLLPELAPRLPSRRRLWNPEPYGMMLFDAVSLALTYYRDTLMNQKAA